ncbi:hypothetical protein [Streptomyces sp. HUAS ZL42]|uniref:AfsR/SARP family transcriptional regulator n=1 Tax=Streptomyces sp. HUAS ZL42 TaxID=3231715 RepID=UPI00345E50AA
MEFRLLGEVRVMLSGRSLDAGTPWYQAVLAAPAVDPGRPALIETLIDRIRGDDPPAEARNAVWAQFLYREALSRVADVSPAARPSGPSALAAATVRPMATVHPSGPTATRLNHSRQAQRPPRRRDWQISNTVLNYGVTHRLPLKTRLDCDGWGVVGVIIGLGHRRPRNVSVARYDD